MIEVIVGSGEETETFIIHEPLLTTSSLLFKKKLAAASEDGKDTIVLELVGISPIIFGSINRYLYTGGIDSFEHDHLPLLPLYPLCDVWLLADHFGMPKLMNHVIWCLLKQLDKSRVAEVGTGIPASLETIYERAPSKSKLRQLMLDICVWLVPDFRQSTKASIQMGWDLFEAMKVQRDAVRNPLSDVRNYYVKENEFAQYEAQPAVPLATGEAPANTASSNSNVPPSGPPTTCAESPISHRPARALSTPTKSGQNPYTPIPQPKTPVVTPRSPILVAINPSTRPHERATVNIPTTTQPSSAISPTPAHKSDSNQTPDTPQHCCLHYESTLCEGLKAANIRSLCRISHQPQPCTVGIPKAEVQTETGSENGSFYDVTPRSSPPPPFVSSFSTRSQLFEPINVPEGTIDSKNYQHISAMPAHENFSPDELRLTDYESLEAGLDKLEAAYDRCKEAGRQEPKVEETEVIAISSDSETDTSSEHDQELPSKVRVNGIWRWRQYIGPAVKATPSSRTASGQGDNKEGRVWMPPTPPPSAEKVIPKSTPEAQLSNEAPPKHHGNSKTQKKEESEDSIYAQLDRAYSDRLREGCRAGRR